MTSNRWLFRLDAREPWRTCESVACDTVRRGDRWVAFVGALADRTPLARTLGLASAPTSDAALVLAAFERWGAAASSRLRGRFVAVLADDCRREVSLARDPLGGLPLFFTQIGSQVVCAGSALDLRSQEGASRRLNRAALADHLCHRWPNPTETCFDAIRRLPVAHRLVLRSGSASVERCWDPVPAGRAVAWLQDDVAAQFLARFHHAIDRALVGGATGVFLSGGLDSISVAAAAADRARATGRPLPIALSLGMDDPACDERRRQVSVARTLGLRSHLVDFDCAVGPAGLLPEALALSRCLSSPLLNIWAPAYVALARRSAAEGVRVILSGGGGDEWLSVSPYLSADLLAGGAVADWGRFVAAYRRSYPLSAWTAARQAAWTFGVRPLLSRALARALPRAWNACRRLRATRRDPDWVAPDEALRREQRDRAAGALFSADPPEGFYLRELRAGLDHPLTAWELEEQHELGQRAGVVFTHPYWDPDLVDMLYRTPPARLMAGGWAKALVRGDLARRFPDLGLAGQRKVPGAGYHRRLVRRDLPLVAAALGPLATLESLGVIDDRAARRYADPAFARPAQAWDLVNLEAWARAHT